MKTRIPLIILLVVIGLFTGLIFPNKVNAAGVVEPRVVVTNYQIDNGGINSGEPTKVTITLKNMDATHTVNNILLTCSNSNNYFTAEYGTSNQVYINTLAPSQEKQVEILLIAKEGININSLVANINISFVDDQGQSYSSDSQIVIPVKGSELQLSKVNIPDSVVVNEKSRISISCENLANKEVYDVTITIKGDNSKENSSNIGSLVLGSKKSQDMYMTFDNIGNHQITVQLSYKDAGGTTHQMIPHQYQINVVDANTQVSNKTNTSNTVRKYSDFIKPAAYAAATIICIVISIVWFKLNKKNL